MYLLGVLLSIVLTASAESSEKAKKCLEGLNYPDQCCKNPLGKMEPMKDENVKECMLIPRVPGSCDRDMCFGTKKGFVTADGSVKKDLLHKDLEKVLGDHKDVLEAIDENCFEVDLEDYGDPDECSVGKMVNCIRWQTKFRCTEFSNEGPCEGLKDLAKQCLEMNS